MKEETKYKIYRQALCQSIKSRIMHQRKNKEKSKIETKNKLI